MPIVHAQATDYDELATLIVRDPIGPTLERVTELMDDPLVSA